VFVWNVRRYVLRRNALKRPWFFPWAVFSYVYAAIKAWRQARLGKPPQRQLRQQQRSSQQTATTTVAPVET
jgi:hypothetical protein